MEDPCEYWKGNSLRCYNIQSNGKAECLLDNPLSLTHLQMTPMTGLLLACHRVRKHRLAEIWVWWPQCCSRRLRALRFVYVCCYATKRSHVNRIAKTMRRSSMLHVVKRLLLYTRPFSRTCNSVFGVRHSWLEPEWFSRGNFEGTRSQDGYYSLIILVFRRYCPNILPKVLSDNTFGTGNTFGKLAHHNLLAHHMRHDTIGCDDA